MQTQFIEKLPNGLSLFRLENCVVVLPGQWLSFKEHHFPVIQSSLDQTLILINEVADKKLLESIQQANRSDFTVEGVAFDLPDVDDGLIFIAEDHSIALLFALINYLKDQWGLKTLRSRLRLVLFGTHSIFPFTTVPSLFMLPEFKSHTIASSQLLEDLKIPARLASVDELPGCFTGTLQALIEDINIHSFVPHDATVVAFGDKHFLTDIKKLLANKINKQHLILYPH